MTSHHVRPIGPHALKELRATDDAGLPCVPFADLEGGAPLRCCLRRSETGERIALVSYAPLRRWAAETGARPGAYDEQGPVFVHAEECAGPDLVGHPFARPGVLRVLRRYSAEGHILGGRLLEIPDQPDAALDEALDEAFADSSVALVHIRAVEHGCYLYEVHHP
ncbi:DUF1203 domain-containing protein [Streptomyces sp. NPDC047070]|uniref:DUF1203 domain-containing protein n=1 Tax=Streptomyces sp. NPDC047070 TaxID=3154923 RepID=UPI0034530FE4